MKRIFLRELKLTWLLSLFAHLFIVLAFSLLLHEKQNDIEVGDEQNVIDSFIAVGEEHAVEQQQVVTPKPSLAVTKKVEQSSDLSIAAAIPKKQEIKKNKIARNSSHKKTGSHSRGVQTDALLAALHAKIQTHQRYPQMAQELEQQGRVTVQFLLLPNGVIQALQILKSSGISNLDQAALAAVNEAAPFAGVDKFISKSQTFKIDVVFELA